MTAVLGDLLAIVAVMLKNLDWLGKVLVFGQSLDFEGAVGYAQGFQSRGNS